ncbi:MAG TPA: isocitrate/isopropylmalate family dehydrogenase [Gaiellaceae bacterium]|nr:isocitrate/isopropylmalate family dehydrogenase [Gaiellaceae bacterium]
MKKEVSAVNDTKTVACLAGDGVGPELMAAAARALDGVARLHSLEVADVHLPFGGEAVTRSGHALPSLTRSAYRDVDAILVASPREPALDGVKADLHLSWRIARVHFGANRDVVFFGAVDAANDGKAIARAFTCAASRRGRVACVGACAAWRDAVERERSRWGGLDVVEPTLGEALVGLKEDPAGFDVLVSESHLMTPLVDAAAHFAESKTAVAHAWLPDDGPGIFVPGSTDADEHGGFGVADPTAMLFTTSLLLAEGLRRRSASRTLERAVGEAIDTDASRETRPFTDAVLELLPQARTDIEHFEGAWR